VWIARFAIPGGLVVALGAGAALAWPGSDTPQDVPAAQASAPSNAIVVPDRDFRSSRNAARPPVSTPAPKPSARIPARKIPTPKRAAATVKPTPTPTPPKVIGTKYVTVNLNVRLSPSETGSLLSVLSAGTKVAVTGKTDGEWAQIVQDGKIRWVKAQYLADKMPAPAPVEEPTGISAAPCKSGSAVEDGLQPDTIRVHRAVCALFPEVSSYGGLRSGDSGEHGTGRALDIMITGATGDEIAAYVRANSKALGVSEVIWEQRIWTVERSSEGWRPMEDRGSTTANHMDHVHVTTYGDAGTS
jgi:hypothetical protein